MRFPERLRRVAVRSFGLGAVAVCALAACEPGPVPPEAIRARLEKIPQPNLVLIVVDTLRADWTSAYGFPQETSPELARWAGRGLLFERAYSQSSWTKMSMSSLLTSLWPRSHAITDARDGLSGDAVTVAEVLRDAGYATYAVQTNGWLHQSFGVHQGFERYSFPHGKSRRIEKATAWSHADRVYEEAVRLIDAHDRERPFFLYLHYMDVHEYAAPTEFKQFGTDSRGAYLASIRWVDDAVERVRRKLDAASYLDETILVFAADHGETFGEHGVHGHARNVLTPVVWVPLVFRLPFAVEPVRIASQVRNLDIAPTLLDLAGLAPPPSFEGRTLLPLATGEEPLADRASYAALGKPLFPDASIQVALNEGDWSYARNLEAEAKIPELLFDRSVDPRENVNLIELEPGQAERLRALLDAHLEEGPAGVHRTGVRIEPSIEQRLRAMGYLEEGLPASEPESP